MKKLDAKAFNEVRTWVYRNARPLDLAIWQLQFEEGTREHVMDMLRFYQNGDGGFGNGLDADCWNTESSPYATMLAIGIMQSNGLLCPGQPVIHEILQYLDKCPHCTENGWLFCIPSNDNWPRAPWWTYDETVNAVESMGVTAALCAFILGFGDRQSPLYDRACGYVERILGSLGHTTDFGESGLGGVGMLVMAIDAAGLSERFDCSVAKAEMENLVNRSIERDPAKWADYTPRPSNFIWSPDCPFYAGNEEIVEQELDYLIDTRNPGGVWDITWSWYQLGEQYPKEFAISENWYKANKAVEKIHYLKCFNRI